MGAIGPEPNCYWQRYPEIIILAVYLPKAVSACPRLKNSPNMTPHPTIVAKVGKVDLAFRLV
jgi:hypothetical protein